METRRYFIQKIITFIGAVAFRGYTKSSVPIKRKNIMNTKSSIYRCINGNPSENMTKVIELMGGIEHLFGPDDVIVIKPNVQWWNQGAPNIAAVNTFVSLIMEHPKGFSGEIVLAENNHRGDSSPWNTVGWQKPFERNSDLPGINNYNELSRHLKKKLGDKFSTCYWIDIDSGGKRVYSPEDGTGYVLCDGTNGVPLISLDNGLQDENRREVIMSYPIFKTDRGTIIDFKNGIWENGSYTDQPLRFINVAALNHHSSYCGPTSSVKNHLGVNDLSGGSDPENGGKLSGEYNNFHSFPFNRHKLGPVPGMLGAEIGEFFNTIRKPDLNITTAEWIGLASRTEPPVAHTKAILASTDPVALDYHATKYLFYPNSHIPKHNPDNKKGPLYNDLKKCAKQSKMIIDEGYVNIKSYDFSKKRFQNDDELVVKADIKWRFDIKMLLKYILFRFDIV